MYVCVFNHYSYYSQCDIQSVNIFIFKKILAHNYTVKCIKCQTSCATILFRKCIESGAMDYTSSWQLVQFGNVRFEILNVSTLYHTYDQTWYSIVITENSVNKSVK